MVGSDAPSSDRGGQPRRSVESGRLRRWLLESRWAPYLAALIAVAVVLTTTWFVDNTEQDRFQNDRRAEVLYQVSAKRANLEKALNARLHLVHGLAAYVAANPDFEDAQFEMFASGLLDQQEGVRQLALTRGSVVTHVYPREGNEAVLGVDLMTVPDQREAVRRGLEDRQFVLAGPVALVQGGVALVARLPIILSAADGTLRAETVWGLSLIIVEIDPLLADAGLGNSTTGLTWALRGRDGLGSSGEVFFGDEAVFHSSPETLDISLPGGTWSLAATPTGGWPSMAPGSWRNRGAGGLLAILVGTLIFKLMRDPARLREKIASATAALSEREQQYRSLFDHNPDMVYSMNLEGNFTAVNEASEKLTGYTVTELMGTGGLRLIAPEEVERVIEVGTRAAQGEPQNLETIMVRQDGRRVDIHATLLPIIVNGKVTGVYGISKDITERREAYQTLERQVNERTRELSTLLDVSRTLGSTLEMSSLIDLILDQLKTVVDYTSVRVRLLDGDDLVVLAERGPLSRRDTGGTRRPLSDFILPRLVIERRESVIIDDVRADESPMMQRYRVIYGAELQTSLSYMRAWLGVPLLVRDRVIGLLSIGHHEPGYYTARHAELTLAFANQAASAIENAHLYAQAQDRAVLEERQRLARELHDSVSQALYGIALGARTARTLLEKDAHQAREPLEYVLSLAAAGIAEMRALIFALRPESLEQEGLVAALEKHVAVLRARHGIEVTATLENEPEQSIEVKQALYRIAQEALHNTVKHARARHVVVRLANAEGTVVLEVGDDGQGFDPKGEFPGHLGLRSMRERVEGLGGTLVVDSAPGQGTHIRASIPTGPVSDREASLAAST